MSESIWRVAHVGSISSVGYLGRRISSLGLVLSLWRVMRWLSLLDWLRNGICWLLHRD